MLEATGHIARRFPLVARPRPAYPPLDARVREMCDLAQTAGLPGVDRLALAASAHNRAALIASDCGLPNLARALCWQQFDVYQRARPLSGQAARFALEPIVNLARLRIRDGDGQTAYDLLDTLFHAVRSHTDADIEGRTVAFHRFARTDKEHRELCRWLWTVLLADGTRALTSAGQWHAALVHAERHHGVGKRLLDGRQIATLAHCMTGEQATALTILDESTLVEPWEDAVAACLTVLCLTSAGLPPDPAIPTAIGHYLSLDPTPEHLVFRTRLGLTILDLTDNSEHPDIAQVADRIVTEAIMTGNGYVARDILNNEKCAGQINAKEEQLLSAAMHRTGLGRGTLPAHLFAELHSAVAIAEAITAESLATAAPPQE